MTLLHPMRQVPLTECTPIQPPAAGTRSIGRRPLAWTCEDRRMVEYGNGVGEVAGRAGGGGGGQAPDVGATPSRMLNDSVTTLSSMPPAALLLLGAVVLVVGWMLLKRI